MALLGECICYVWDYLLFVKQYRTIPIIGIVLYGLEMFLSIFIKYILQISTKDSLSRQL